MQSRRQSHHALADGRASLDRAKELVGQLPNADDVGSACRDLMGVLDTTIGHCGELIQLLALEERSGLTAVRGNAQLALRRLDTNTVAVDTTSLRVSLKAILNSTDRLLRHVEELEATIGVPDPTPNRQH